MTSAADEKEDNAKARFKPRSDAGPRQGFDVAPTRLHPATARSRPISASDEWPHACDRGIAVRCSSAPSSAVIELEKMRTATLGESAPFLGDCVECMRRHSCRHGGAGSQRSWRRGIVWSGTRTSNDRPLTGSLHPRHISESLDIIVLLRGTRAGAAKPGEISLARGRGQKTDPPGRGNPGGSR
jgi:hypothetical protein